MPSRFVFFSLLRKFHPITPLTHLISVVARPIFFFILIFSLFIFSLLFIFSFISRFCVLCLFDFLHSVTVFHADHVLFFFSVVRFFNLIFSRFHCHFSFLSFSLFLYLIFDQFWFIFLEMGKVRTRFSSSLDKNVCSSPPSVKKLITHSSLSTKNSEGKFQKKKKNAGWSLDPPLNINRDFFSLIWDLKFEFFFFSVNDQKL